MYGDAQLSCCRTCNLSTCVYLSNTIWVCSGKILAYARNYAAHAKELQNVVPKQPVLFMMPSTSIVSERESVVLPREVLGADNPSVDYEVELGLVIGKQGRRIAPEKALDHVDGFVLALDMTARSCQNAAAKEGLPWTIGKGMDTMTPLSSVVPLGDVVDAAVKRTQHEGGDGMGQMDEGVLDVQAAHDLIKQLQLTLRVNGDLRQRDSISSLVWDIPTLIADASKGFTLEAGDIVLTGTPAGVGPVFEGDQLEAALWRSTDPERNGAVTRDMLDRRRFGAKDKNLLASIHIDVKADGRTDAA